MNNNDNKKYEHFEKKASSENNGSNEQECSETPISAENSADTENPIQTDAAVPKKMSNNAKLLRNIFDWLETFAFAFAFVLILFTFLMKIVTVDGSSMNYTLADGDRLIISNAAYQPKYGDIIVISNEVTQKPIIKRVIATEGQKVEINFNTWEISVDGNKLVEPYINNEDQFAGIPLLSEWCVPSFVVGENQVFALGDNRNHSSDSRHYGTYEMQNDGTFVYSGFATDDILGRVLIRITPFDKFGVIKPSSEN